MSAETWHRDGDEMVFGFEVADLPGGTERTVPVNVANLRMILRQAGYRLVPADEGMPTSARYMATTDAPVSPILAERERIINALTVDVDPFLKALIGINSVATDMLTWVVGVVRDEADR